MSVALALLGPPALLLLPGCWLVFAPRNSPWPAGARLALAVVLSPLVAVLEFYLLRFAGLGFAAAATGAALLNLPALLLVRRGLATGSSGGSGRPGLAGVAAFLVVAACVAIPYLWEPAFRPFSWHSLMHTDIIYSVARSGLVPEEPELAGLPLAYPWLTHTYWAMLAWVLDLSPTLVYVLVNLVLLGATGVLTHATARRLGASPRLALAAPLALALGPNLVGIAGWAAVPSNATALWWALFGDLRTAPFLQKLSAFESMNFGLALFAGLLLLCLEPPARQDRLTRLLGPLLVLGVAALYPNLYPAAVVLLLAWPVLLLLERWGGARERIEPGFGGAAARGLAAAAVGGLFIALFSLERSGAAAGLTPLPGLAKKAVAAGLGLGPFLLAGWWAVSRTPAPRALLALGLAALGSVALNLGLRLPGLNEYKFFFTAGICLTPLVLIGLERRWLGAPARQRALLVLLPTLLAGSMLAYAIRQLPPPVPAAYAIREGDFALAFAAGTPAAGWTDAVRRDTPANTVLLAYRPEFHTTSFTGRTLFVPTDPAEPHFGYNSVSRFNLVDVRGYSASLWDGRIALLELLYHERNPAALAEAWGRLRTLARPLALHFGPGQAAGLQAWLDRESIGRELYRGPDGTVVRLVEP